MTADCAMMTHDIMANLLVSTPRNGNATQAESIQYHVVETGLN